MTICAVYRDESGHLFPEKCIGGDSFHNPHVQSWTKPKGMQVRALVAFPQQTLTLHSMLHNRIRHSK